MNSELIRARGVFWFVSFFFNFSRCQCLRNKTGLFNSFFSVHVHVSKQKKSVLNTLNIWPWDLIEVTAGKQTSWYLSFENT